MSLGLSNRLRYLLARARRIDAGSVIERARAVGKQHGKASLPILVDMLREAAFKDTAFQDYVDWDYAILTAEERATFMTHPLSNQIAQRYNAPAQRPLFQDKIAFNKVFDALLLRSWLDVRETTADGLRAFAEQHPVMIAKVLSGHAGHGVSRYLAAEVTDWAAFRAELLEKKQYLVEEAIVQHPVLAEICPGTAQTTRITSFFDGETVHMLTMAQKFGRGQASDQQSFGGFYSMLEVDGPDAGKARGKGYDSHDNVYAAHPDSGVSIPDFRLPRVAEAFAVIEKAARVVPEIQYVGWDVVVREHDVVLIEGNWGVGIYENKPSVTGIRTGARPRYRAAVGF